MTVGAEARARRRPWRWLLLGALLGALLGPLACGDPDEAPGDVATHDAPDAVDAAGVLLGVGEAASFVTLAEAGEVEIVAGGQGGFHLEITTRLRQIPPEGVSLTYEVRVADQTRPINVPTRYVLSASRVPCDPSGTVCDRVADRVILDTLEPEALIGVALVVSVSARASSGEVHEDSAQVTARRIIDGL